MYELEAAMKGLLVKDFKILKLQKNTLFLFLFIALFLTAFSDDASFVICYFTFVSSLYSLSSISYDEFDNGNAFLFSLPITRKNYVIEKYCFSFILSMSSCFFATILVIITEMIRGTDSSIIDIIMIALITIPIMLIVISIMLPFQLKFGGDKGRIAIICAVGIVFVVGIVILKVAEFFSIDIASIINGLPVFSTGMIIVAALIAVIVILMISIRISISIVKKKEF